MAQIFLFLARAIDLLIILLFIRIILSWVMPRANPYEQPFKLLYDLTEPLMGPFRRLIPPLGGIDFSPILLFIALQFLSGVLVNLSRQVAFSGM